jgi:hypothetical protein
MRRVIGIVVLTVSALAGIMLLLTGNLARSRVLQEASWSGGTGPSQWTETVTVVAFSPN